VVTITTYFPRTTMHIRDGILSPEVCLATGALALGAVGYSVRQMRRDLAERTVPYTGMTAALIFAAQMVNFPLLFQPVSGHLLGGVLAGVLLGPWGGCVALTLVLVVQALLFADGGLFSLGANVLNMAVIGSWGGWAVYAGLRRLLGFSTGATVASAVSAAYLSVLLAAAAFCLEFGASHRAAEFDLGRVFTLMLLFHAAIGLGEGLITGLVVRWLLIRRPEMIVAPVLAAPHGWRARRLIAAGLCCSLAIAVGLAPFASEWPDGLDAVGETLNFNALGKSSALILEDYALPVPAGMWEPLSVSLAGLCGTLVVFAIGWLLGRMVEPKRALRGEYGMADGG
jgi:cobalt/nickel transport system permease protein